MGCGTSGQIHAVSPQPPTNEPELLVKLVPQQPIPKLEQAKPTEPAKPEGAAMQVREVREFRRPRPKPQRRQFCFLFGETNEQRKIISFNAKQLGFSTISSRSKVPSPPLKYQPIEVIYQESQELFSSNLFSSNSHPPYNFMLALWLDHEKILLCGGVSYDFDHISSEAFLFDSRSDAPAGTKKLGNNLMGTRFEKLPFMHVRRYSHMGVVMTIESLKYVFVFGGRTEGDQIIQACEKYSVTERKWKKIAPMAVARSTGFSLVFKSRIYVFGGYSGKSKRSKKIECYWPEKDYWETLDIKLHRGIETGLLFSIRPNEVMIIGGNLQNGSVKSAIRLNLEELTYVFDSEMKRERVLQKGIQTDTDIIVFGGDFMDGLELYNVKEKRWYYIQLLRRQNNTSYAPHVSPQDINSFSFSAETVNVEHEELAPPKNEQYPDERICLFANDETPCILEINLTKNICKKKAVPMTLRLRSYMGSVLVKPGKHFLCGGTSQYFEKASKSTYIYYMATNNCVQQTKMLEARYSFGVCLLDDYVYVFGGKRTQDQILSSCQRFNIEANTWERLPNLERARHSHLAIPLKDKIYIVGGCNQLMCVDEVEMQKSLLFSYDPKEGKFINLGYDLHLTLKAGLAVHYQNEIYLLGGYDNLGQNTYLQRLRIEESEEGRQQLQVDKLQQVDRVLKATSSSTGLVLFRPNRTSTWQDKHLSQRILINQLQINALDLSKCVLS